MTHLLFKLFCQNLNLPLEEEILEATFLLHLKYTTLKFCIKFITLQLYLNLDLERKGPMQVWEYIMQILHWISTKELQWFNSRIWLYTWVHRCCTTWWSHSKLPNSLVRSFSELVVPASNSLSCIQLLTKAFKIWHATNTLGVLIYIANLSMLKHASVLFTLS